MPDAQAVGAAAEITQKLTRSARCDAMAGWDRVQCHGWHLAETAVKGSSLVAVFGAILACLFLVLLWKAQRDRDNPVDVTEWLRDPSTGLTSRRALGELVGLFISTFGVVAFGLSDMDPAWKVTAYMFYSLLWVSRSLLGAFIQMRFGGGQPVADRETEPQQPAVTTTTTTAVRGPAAPPVPPPAAVKRTVRVAKKGRRRRGYGPPE